MALPLPPSSNLHSILLITKSRSLGPRLVFHYPPLSPSAADLSTKKAPVWFGAETSAGSVVDSNSSSSEWDSSTENDGGDDDADVGSRKSVDRGSGKTGNSQSHRGEKEGRFRPGAGGAWGRQENIDEEDTDNGEGGEGLKKDGSGVPKDRDWDNVLGFKVDALEKMLCPERAFNKRKFELGVESVVFVGAPMFVRDDGLWKKMKKKRRKRSAEERAKDGGNIVSNMATEESEEEDETRKKPPLKKNESFIFPPGFEPGYGHGMMSGPPSIAASEAGSDTRSNSTTNGSPDMTMFNVVFVLNPPALEYQLRVKDIYDNVTKKYAKALKYEQARFQYVWSESKRIIDIKQRAKENNESLTATWQKIMSTSPLAKSIATLFEAVSHDRIAHIHFDASFNSSFQIPQADSTPYLPNALEPQMPGLWLTTSNVAAHDDDGAPMTQHAALLLLEDPEVIIKDIQSAGDNKNAATLAIYIRSIVPTKSLLKLATKYNISAADMEYTAMHLVHWRRARLITPLHPRDIYIVSPNADLSALQAATAAYAIRFPTYPSLPKMLSLLSGTPRIYRSVIPTAEHTDAFMDILAWLMRGGWVTQLRTFAWVRVSPEIKRLVVIDMAQEEIKEQQRKAAEEQHQKDMEALGDSTISDKRASLLSAGSGRPGTPLRRTRRDRDRDRERGRERDGSEDGTDALSPRPGPTGWRGSPARAESDTGSTSSARTTIPYISGRPTSPAQTSHSRGGGGGGDQNLPHRPSPLHLKPASPSSRSRHSSQHPFSPTATNIPPPSPPLSPQSFKPSLILNPQKASSLETRWLEKIAEGFEDEELKEKWPMLLKYFDGTRATNDISPREGLKRNKVDALIRAVRERGLLVVVRHW
ncbi:hypothetical protein CC80DRAFT_477681 [Byssothecium circinans]|uniref:Nitrogen permease regulator 3 n=1 Tax=Byssothecium circinans TaxID=147558 RepID=A0A6A5TWG6_9PLEO|nr:hypothetical protein CC80DRAFT_477681 [Byssothecium circinans]